MFFSIWVLILRFFNVNDCSVCSLKGRDDFDYLGLLVSSMLLLMMLLLCKNVLDVFIRD